MLGASAHALRSSPSMCFVCSGRERKRIGRWERRKAVGKVEEKES